MSVRFAHLLGATPPGQEGSLLSIFYQVFYPDTKLSEIDQTAELKFDYQLKEMEE